MAAELRLYPISSPASPPPGITRCLLVGIRFQPFFSSSAPLPFPAALNLLARSSDRHLYRTFLSGGGSPGGPRHRGGGYGDDNGFHDEKPERSDSVGPIGLFINGWRSRVLADPQFPFKLLMEELIGVSACVLGDMASRPNFGINELDFVFCTLVVGSIVNFVLMYLLAPTAAASSTAAVVTSLPSYMFESGPFSLMDRIGTFAYKGATFAAVGFAAGLAGTAIANWLIALRKMMDPEFETPNKPPPTVLNATTWALHMGLSSNFRYQTLNGLEFVMEKAVSPAAFKTLVVVIRCLNNVLGGMSFVMLARLTGSQKVAIEEENMVQKERLMRDRAVVLTASSEDGEAELQSNESRTNK
ncbi:protein RETICULATA-RELATED 3, chloroplastic-like [Phalaenopsis equestris]|uniref:protein RETICULATA-RELATED 3, chloroplastic-like n=1 Tax=Phalaenopsis equestris TaxID=78828 RepID=UPI0009E1C4AE|nr:protein RETICULATA-RELATED 3, chloroplastic-like [Phalaenopsis equestris]